MHREVGNKNKKMRGPLNCCLSLALLLGAMSARAAVTPEMQQAIRAATFEVVMKKPADPLTYEKPLPLDLLPFVERNDAYRSVGTAFSLGHNTYVTAAHVFGAGVNSQYGPPMLRGSDTKVHPIERILKFSLREDMVVFSVADDPAPTGLSVNRTPKVDDVVLAVGNALGEGIVIRDGLLTSQTPEEQDGSWKWIRFSAAASPGNSGGPLLDGSGNVIGIVLRKSQNENLNYSLPIDLVLDAPAKAVFDQRTVTALPFMHGTRTYAYKDEFKLPLSWNEFVKAFTALTERHTAEARAQLLAEYAPKAFATGVGADALLYSSDPGSYELRLIHQDADDTWTAVGPGSKRTDLPGDGFLTVGVQETVAVLRLHRSDNASDDAFYNDSKAFMDIAAKALDILRVVGTDKIRVTSLGPAVSNTLIVDRYGRKWQERKWALPYLDAYVVGMLLPTPDGYSAVMQISPSAFVPFIESSLRLFIEQADVSYVGTLAQWKAYLKRQSLLAEPLKSLSLEQKAGAGWNVRSSKFEFQIPDALFALDEHSTLGMSMQYLPGKPTLQWDVSGAWWFRDEERRSKIGLRRRSRPPATAKSEYRNLYTDMWERRAPYDAQSTHPTSTAYQSIQVVNVPGQEGRGIAADALYTLSVELDGRDSYKSISELLRRTVADTHILECCVGASVEAPKSAETSSSGGAALAADTSADTAINSGKAVRAAALAGGSDDTYRGRDVRGRVMSQDFREFLWDPKENAEAKNAARGHTQQEWNLRYNALLQYWVIVPALMHNRDLWRPFVTRNGQPNWGHSIVVSRAETELQSVLKDHPPGLDWPDAANKLRVAYIKERNGLAEGLLRSKEPSAFISRVAGCPAAATSNSGIVTPTILSVKHSPADFYPKAVRDDQVEGTVIVLAKVDAKGCAVAAAIVASSGSDPLDHAAIDYVDSLEFLPAAENDAAVEGRFRTSVTFKLPET